MVAFLGVWLGSCGGETVVRARPWLIGGRKMTMSRWRGEESYYGGFVSREAGQVAPFALASAVTAVEKEGSRRAEKEAKGGVSDWRLSIVWGCGSGRPSTEGAKRYKRDR